MSSEKNPCRGDKTGEYSADYCLEHDRSVFLCADHLRKATTEAGVAELLKKQTDQLNANSQLMAKAAITLLRQQQRISVLHGMLKKTLLAVVAEQLDAEIEKAVEEQVNPENNPLLGLIQKAAAAQAEKAEKAEPTGLNDLKSATKDPLDTIFDAEEDEEKDDFLGLGGPGAN